MALIDSQRHIDAGHDKPAVQDRRCGRIVRHRHSRNFTTIPNAIFKNPGLSLSSKGLLGFLLSKPPSWQTRHDHLLRELGIGRKLLNRCIEELIAEGYCERDETQGRDEHNRFTPLNYVIRDIPKPVDPSRPEPQRPGPSRERSNGNNKDEIKKEPTNPFSKSLPTEQAQREQARLPRGNQGDSGASIRMRELRRARDAGRA